MEVMLSNPEKKAIEWRIQSDCLERNTEGVTVPD